MAFDVPSKDFHSKKFEERYAFLLSHIPLGDPYSVSLIIKIFITKYI